MALKTSFGFERSIAVEVAAMASTTSGLEKPREVGRRDAHLQVRPTCHMVHLIVCIQLIMPHVQNHFVKPRGLNEWFCKVKGVKYLGFLV